MKSALLLIPGALFGWGLVLSGMTQPTKVAGFLDLAGAWDPSLLFTMGGAVVTFALLNVFVHKRQAPVLGGELPGPRSKGALTPRLFVGASLFGVGWGISGVCPGPALVDLSSGSTDVFAFVGAMLVGMVLAQRVFGADAPAATCAADASGACSAEAAPAQEVEPSETLVGAGS